MSETQEDPTLAAELAAMPPPPATRQKKAARPMVNLEPPGTVHAALKEEGAAPAAISPPEAPQVIGPAGGEAEAPSVAAPEAPMIVGPVHRLAGEPGALLRQAVAIVPRDPGRGLAGVSPDRLRHRQRIAEMAGQISHLVRVANGAAANIRALAKALRDGHGGAEEAEKEGFDLGKALAFCEALDGVLETYAPAKGQTLKS